MLTYYLGVTYLIISMLIIGSMILAPVLVIGIFISNTIISYFKDSVKRYVKSLVFGANFAKYVLIAWVISYYLFIAFYSLKDAAVFVVVMVMMSAPFFYTVMLMVGSAIGYIWSVLRQGERWNVWLIFGSIVSVTTLSLVVYLTWVFVEYLGRFAVSPFMFFYLE